MARCLLVLFVLSLPAWSVEPWDAPVTVPPGVTYKKADAETLRGAVQLLRNGLKLPSAQRVLGNAVVVGPFLWARLRNDSRLAKVEGPAVHFEPFNLEGKALKGPSSTAVLEDAIRAELAQDGPFAVRRPSSEELEIYWALSPSDIEEPIFVVESAHHSYLMDFEQGTVFWVDDFYGVSKASLRRS